MVHPLPNRPPRSEIVSPAESLCSPDKLLATVYILGGNEFADNKIATFTNEEGNILSIGPHFVSRYQLGGPISHGLFGPVKASFVKVINRSYVGQSWYEVTCADYESYVGEWSESCPSVTVVSLGLWDVLMGRCGWTPQCARKGMFGTYFLDCLEHFLARAREYCRCNGIDFAAWYSHHTFIFLSLPNWFTLTPELETPFTISVATWSRFRRICYTDIYPLQTHLWSKYRALYFHPEMPVNTIRTVGDCFLLGPVFSKLYLSQVFDKVARVLCISPGCRVPNDFKLMRKHVLGYPTAGDGSCGKFYAWFLPVGFSYMDLYNLGLC